MMIQTINDANVHTQFDESESESKSKLKRHKPELKRLYAMNLELQSLEIEIEMYRKDIYSLQGIDYSRERVQGGVGMDLVDKIAKLNEMISKANKKWDELIDYRVDVRNNIDRIDDNMSRTILVQRYIRCLKWEEISAFIGYSWKQTHRLHKKALKLYYDIE